MLEYVVVKYIFRDNIINGTLCVTILRGRILAEQQLLMLLQWNLWSGCPYMAGVTSSESNLRVKTLSHLNKFRPHPCIPELIWQIYLYYLI